MFGDYGPQNRKYTTSKGSNDVLTPSNVVLQEMEGPAAVRPLFVWLARAIGFVTTSLLGLVVYSTHFFGNPDDTNSVDHTLSTSGTYRFIAIWVVIAIVVSIVSGWLARPLAHRLSSSRNTDDSG